MIQQTQTVPQGDASPGLITLPNLLAIPVGASPNCLDVKFDIGGIIQKRFGSTTMNATVLTSSAATGFSPDSGGTLASGLVAYWPLDEQAGTRLDHFDGVNLTDNNSVGYGTGKQSNAALFVSANSEYLSAANVSGLQAGPLSFGLAGWVYLTTSQTVDQTFVAKWSGANTANREYRLWYDAARDRFAYSLRAGTLESVVYANTLGSPTTATWYFLAAWRDSAAGMQYLQANTLTANSAAFTSSVNTGSASVTVGVLSDSPAFRVDTGGHLANGLRAAWSLEEASGSRMDQSGNGNTLIPNATVLVAPGRVGSGVSLLNSDTAHLVLHNATALDFGNTDFYLSCWVRFLGLSVDVNQRLIQTLDTAGSLKPYEVFFHGQDGVQRIQAVFIGPASQVTVSANSFGALSTDTWYFVEAWHDSTNGIVAVGVNLSVNSAAYTGGVSSGTNTVFTLGGWPNTNSTEFFAGTMDCVTVYSRVPSVAERLDLYFGGSGNQYGFDYTEGKIDELGLWRNKAFSNQERRDLYNGATGNTYLPGFASAGFGSFDFGAGASLRWHTVAAGTGIYASSNRGVSYIAIASDRSSAYQEFERSKNLLIAVSSTHNRVLYWAGSVGTFMVGLPIGSAPAAKHALDFNGYLFLMNESAGNKRLVKYNDNNTIATGPFTSTFSVDSSDDDEITGGIKYNTRAYIFTKYTTHQVTPTGGNPDFSVRQVKSWGAVPRTIKRATFRDVGEVILALGYDKKVRIFDGAEDRIISTAVERDNGRCPVFLEGINTDYLESCHAEVDTVEQVYKLWLVMAPSINVTHCLCLNLRTGSWYPYADSKLNTAVMAESGNSRILLAVKQDGYVYHMDTSNTHSGVPIDESYESRLWGGEDPTGIYKYHRFTGFFLPTSSGTLHFQDAVNGQTTFGPPRATLAMAGASGVVLQKWSLDVPVTENLYQFRLSSSASTADPWTATWLGVTREKKGTGNG